MLTKPLGALRNLRGLGRRMVRRRLKRALPGATLLAAASTGPLATARAADVDAFLSVARQSFLRMQIAWDAADLPALAILAAEPLLQDLRAQLQERGPGPNRTEVLELSARLLALEDLHEALVASVEFSGVIREQLGSSAAPFRELWLLAKPKAAGQGWQLAQVQSLF